MTEDIGSKRRAFYRHVLEAAGARLGPGFQVPDVGERGQQAFRSGEFGAYWIWFARDGLRVVAYVDNRAGDAELNRRIVEMLIDDAKPRLESVADHPVTVDIDPDRRAQWIGFVRPTPALDDAAATEEAADWATAMVVALVGVLDRHLRAGVVATSALDATSEPRVRSDADGDANRWELLREELTRGLVAIGTSSWIIIGVNGTAQEMTPSVWSAERFVQGYVGADDLLVEVISNHYLYGENQLSSGQEDALRAMGWSDPSADLRRPGANGNFHRRYPHDHLSEAVDLLITALRDVLRASFDDLHYDSADTDGTSYALPYMPIPARAASRLRAEGHPDVRADVEMAIARSRRADAVAFRKSGESTVWLGETPVSLRYVDGRPALLRATAQSTTTVPESPELAVVLNEFNRSVDVAKAMHVGDVVLVAIDLLAATVDDQAVTYASTEVAALTEVLVRGLGARGLLGERTPMVAEHETTLAGYI